ncbi:heat shock cognate 70 kDa protein-like [Rutidosis leptorrhynchoides]|uniref:heat shock cognate 70 kDa protein-like n=1 Tax=Rutidosis leptorrhynchoides TaxID=125765 RepID=UPI003A98E3CD
MAGRSESLSIGIDLGTTYSCVAVWQNNRIEVIPNEQGNRTTPSCVAFTETQRLIGDAAKNQVTRNPTNTIFDAKRLIGRRYADASVQSDMKVWPFKIVEGENGKPMIEVTYQGVTKQISAEETSSMVLTKMKETADTYLNHNVTSAVITVPAYFNDLQRQATKDAATVAGLKVLHLISEPTAAAIAYGLEHKSKDGGAIRHVVIFDLGGGTFDVSLVTVNEGKIEVKAVGGDTHLGGEDFDNRMVDYFVFEFNMKEKKDISMNPRALARLRVTCERAKRILSSTTFTPVEIDCLYDGVDFSGKITRAKFEELNMGFFNKCMEIVQMCLEDAKWEKEMVDEVVLVGGSTRIPKVQQMLQEFFEGKKLCKTINPDEAVAYGAAVLAAKISGQGDQMVQELTLSDVTPLSLGDYAPGDVMSVMIPKNTPIPVMRECIIGTLKDYQTNFEFKVYQGERSKATDNIHLGEFSLYNLPPAPRGVTKAKLRFEIDVNGLLEVSAEELTTGHKETIKITNGKRSLANEEIEKMLNDAEKFKVEDQNYHKKVEAYNDLEYYIYRMKRTVKDDSDRKRLKPEEMSKMDDLVEGAMVWLEIYKVAEVDVIAEKKKKLECVCNAIIGQCM